MGWNIFQKFLNKLMQRERDSGGLKYFFENFILLESQLDPPINAVFGLSLINRLTHPHHNKKAQYLENENEAESRCKRGRQKVRHWRTPEFTQSLEFCC